MQEARSLLNAEHRLESRLDHLRTEVGSMLVGAGETLADVGAVTHGRSLRGRGTGRDLAASVRPVFGGSAGGGAGTRAVACGCGWHRMAGVVFCVGLFFL